MKDFNMNDMVKLALDNYRGRTEKYSSEDAQESIRKGLIELNNGKTTLDYRAIRDGKCPGLFSFIETVLGATTIEGLQGDEYFNQFVDYRNVAEGEQNLFRVDDNDLFVVSKAANGTQGIRRQRLGGAKEIAIPTAMRYVRIYEELNRVLSGRVDFNTMITKVSDSFRQQILNDIYTLWTGVTAEQLGGAAFFPVAGAYDEDKLLDVIAHVEAAAGGKTATVVGTKKALRNLKSSVLADTAKEDLYKYGVYGTFFGTPLVATPQRHKVGTNDFVMDDNMLTITAGDQKPIKFVYEGDPIALAGDPMSNADLTNEYLFGEKYGIGLVVAGNNAGTGRYEISE